MMLYLIKLILTLFQEGQSQTGVFDYTNGILF